MIPKSLELAKESISELEIDDIEKRFLRDSLDISDEAWYEISGAYDQIKEAFGVDVSLGHEAYDSLQAKMEDLAIKQGLEEDLSFEDDLNKYLSAKISVDELLDGRHCFVNETMISCLSRTRQFDSLGKLEPEIFDENGSGYNQIYVFSFEENRLRDELRHELLTDIIIKQISSSLQGCVLSHDTQLLECQAKAQGGHKWSAIVEASYDRYGIYIGKDKKNSLESFKQQLTKAVLSRDPNDSTFYMDGELITGSCLHAGCHDNKKALFVERKFSKSDRVNGAIHGAIAGGALGGIVGSVTGLSAPIVAASGSALGFFVGSVDPSIVAIDASGDYLLPLDHPDVGSEGIEYSSDPIVTDSEQESENSEETSGVDKSRKVDSTETEITGSDRDVEEDFETDFSDLCEDGAELGMGCKSQADYGSKLRNLALSAVCEKPDSSMDDRHFDEALSEVEEIFEKSLIVSVREEKINFDETKSIECSIDEVNCSSEPS